MCFQIGQTVAVVDDTLKGTVVQVENLTITLEDEHGMHYVYEAHELVVLGEDQFEMSKFSDLNNPLLKQKMDSETKQKRSPFKKDKNEVVLEVDLHIHQLVSSTRNMDNYDMLNLQLDTAKRKLDYAIQKRISKLVFIHGVGEGVLKSELSTLFAKYPVTFYDASYQKYGLGATEVYIHQHSN